MKTSESIENISKAMVRCQSTLNNPKNTATNPFFKSKYAPLNDILNYVKPVLKEHGLAIMQDISHDEDRIIVSTMIIHESGEYICQTGASAKPDKDTAQGAGSAITYLRRYTLSAALNISSEDDNDGNAPDVNENHFTDTVQKTFDGEVQTGYDSLMAMVKTVNKESAGGLIKSINQSCNNGTITVDQKAELIGKVNEHIRGS